LINFEPSNEEMIKNIGKTEKVLRITVAVLLILLNYFELITGTATIITLILALIMMLTGLVGSCPLYRVLGINTNKKN